MYQIKAHIHTLFSKLTMTTPKSTMKLCACSEVCLQGYYVLQSLCSGFWQPDSVGSLSICPGTVVLSHLFSWVDVHICDTSRSIPVEIHACAITLT